MDECYSALVKKLALGALLLICACRDRRPPEPTQEQSDQLNEAENMLNNTAVDDPPQRSPAK